MDIRHNNTCKGFGKNIEFQKKLIDLEQLWSSENSPNLTSSILGKLNLCASMSVYNNRKE